MQKGSTERVAILSPFHPYRGGIAQFSDSLLAELHRQGVEAKGFNFKRLYPDLLFPGTTQFVEGVTEAEGVLSSINPLSYHCTVKELKVYAPDVLIISYWMSFFVPAYAHIANRMKRHCKVVVLVHNAIPHEARFFDKPLAKLLFKQCHGFIVMSESVQKEVQQMQSDARCLLNPHPLYSHFGAKMPRAVACEKLGLDEKKKTLLFFGLIRNYKGLDLLIDSMVHLDDSYQLLIAGEAYGSFDSYQTRIEASPAKARIQTHNRYIKDEDLPLFFSAADALVLPYRSATQSGVVSVAYHYDLPMVATPVGDLPNSIARPATGIIADDISATALATATRTLFHEGKWAACIQSIQAEKENLSWKRMVERLRVFMAEL